MRLMPLLWENRGGKGFWGKRGTHYRSKRKEKNVATEDGRCGGKLWEGGLPKGGGKREGSTDSSKEGKKTLQNRPRTKRLKEGGKRGSG